MIRLGSRIALPALAALALVLTWTQAPGADPRVMRQGELKQEQIEGAFKKPKTDSPLRDGVLARGKKNISAAWFSGPNERYRHLPFGTKQHGGVLTVSLADRRVLRLVLPLDSVFEDLMPRIVDADGDGVDEILVVRAGIKDGAALSVVGVRGNELSIIAETPPIGTPFRWLNPVGVADFDGDGKPDIALVVTPHIAGELQFWTMRSGKLFQLDGIDDVSNHVFGSKHLGLAAIADFNGDGIADIAIPNQNRRLLRFITFARGKIQELGEAELPVPAAEDFSVVVVDGKPAVRVGLAGGRGMVISPCRDVQDWRMAKGDC